MSSILDSLKKGIKEQKSTEDKDAILNNLNDSLKQLSEYVLNDVSSEPQKYSLRDMKDLSIIINNLGGANDTNGDGTLPSAPSGVTMYLNANLDSKAKESPVDDESSVNIKNLTTADVSKLINNADKIQNEINYNEGNK